MSVVKLDIQRFSGGGSQWSSGVTKSAVQQALESFNNEIRATQEAIRAWAPVDSALQSGWSGQDCEQYLEKFHQHAEDICEKIEEYRAAVAKEAESIISQWETFQAGLIS